jgi:hypothetical protein
MLLTACETPEFLDDITPPAGSKSILIGKSTAEVQQTLMSNGLTIMSAHDVYKTSVFKIKHVGYVQYELEGYAEGTRITVYHSGNSYKELEPLAYHNDSTKRAFNYLFNLFYNDALYYQK